MVKWIVLSTVLYLVTGGYFSYRVYINKTLGLDRGDTAILARAMLWAWPVVGPIYLIFRLKDTGKFSGLPLTPGYWAERRLAQLAKLEKARKALAGEEVEYEGQEKTGPAGPDWSLIYNQYNQWIKQQIQATPSNPGWTTVTPYTYGGTGGNVTSVTQSQSGNKTNGV